MPAGQLHKTQTTQRIITSSTRDKLRKTLHQMSDFLLTIYVYIYIYYIYIHIYIYISSCPAGILRHRAYKGVEGLELKSQESGAPLLQGMVPIVAVFCW